MEAFIKTMLACGCGHVARHPGLLCHASWSVRLPRGARGPQLCPSLLKGARHWHLKQALSRSNRAGFTRRHVRWSWSCLTALSFHMRIAQLFFDDLTGNSFINRRRLYSCYKCKHSLLHLNGIGAACYLLYSKESRGMEVGRKPVMEIVGCSWIYFSVLFSLTCTVSSFWNGP